MTEFIPPIDMPGFEYEELDPELAACIYPSVHFGDSIKHPLVYSVMHFPALNKRCNAQLRSKKELLIQAEAEGDWHHYVFLHERPYRVQGFMAVMYKMSDTMYWDLLGEIWIDSENIRQNPRVWQTLMGSKRHGRHAMMSAEELADLAAMPAVIPVYQGHTSRRHDGWSWTTDRTKAEWFAHRFASMEGDPPALTSGTVNKADVITYFARRGESEIVAPRAKVKGKETLNLPRQVTTNNAALSNDINTSNNTTSNSGHGTFTQQ